MLSGTPSPNFLQDMSRDLSGVMRACVTAVQQLGQASEFSAQFGSDALFAAVLDPILTDLLDALS